MRILPSLLIAANQLLALKNHNVSPSYFTHFRTILGKYFNLLILKTFAP